MGIVFTTKLNDLSLIPRTNTVKEENKLPLLSSDSPMYAIVFVLTLTNTHIHTYTHTLIHIQTNTHMHTTHIYKYTYTESAEKTLKVSFLL